MSRARVVNVDLIVTTSLAGHGTDEDPLHRIYELWTTNGQLVVSVDDGVEVTQTTSGIGFEQLTEGAWP